MEQWNYLYSEKEKAALSGRRKAGRILCALTGAAGLGAVLCFCLRTGTGNALRMELASALVCTVCGWLIMTLHNGLITPARRELAHAKGLEEGETEEFVSLLSLRGQAARIPGSITAVPLEAAQAQGRRRILVSATRLDRLQPYLKSGEELRLKVVNGFLAAIQPVSAEEDSTDGTGCGKTREAGPSGMAASLRKQAGTGRLRVRKVLSYLPLYGIWAMVSFLLCGWIFTFVTKIPAQQKLTLFADVEKMRSAELDLELEKELPEGIRAIRTHRFSYAMFDDSELLSADLYLVGTGQIEEYRDSFREIPAEVLAALPDSAVLYCLPPLMRDGGTPGEGPAVPYGIKVYDRASGQGLLTDYIEYYKDEGLTQDYYLLFGKNSLHTDDGTAAALALRLLKEYGGASR